MIEAGHGGPGAPVIAAAVIAVSAVSAAAGFGFVERNTPDPMLKNLRRYAATSSRGPDPRRRSSSQGDGSATKSGLTR